MSRIALSFANASCAHCARLVTRTLTAVEGIRSVEVDQANLQMLLDFDPTLVSVFAIRSLLEKAGYPTEARTASRKPRVAMSSIRAA